MRRFVVTGNVLALHEVGELIARRRRSAEDDPRQSSELCQPRQRLGQCRTHANTVHVSLQRQCISIHSRLI